MLALSWTILLTWRKKLSCTDHSVDHQPTVATPRQTSPHCGREHRPGHLLPPPYPTTPALGIALSWKAAPFWSQELPLLARAPTTFPSLPLALPVAVSVWPGSSPAAEPDPPAWLSPLHRPVSTLAGLVLGRGILPCQFSPLLFLSSMYIAVGESTQIGNKAKRGQSVLSTSYYSAVQGPPTSLDCLGQDALIGLFTED